MPEFWRRLRSYRVLLSESTSTPTPSWGVLSSTCTPNSDLKETEVSTISLRRNFNFWPSSKKKRTRTLREGSFVCTPDASTSTERSCDDILVWFTQSSRIYLYLRITFRDKLPLVISLPTLAATREKKSELQRSKRWGSGLRMNFFHKLLVLPGVRYFFRECWKFFEIQNNYVFFGLDFFLSERNVVSKILLEEFSTLSKKKTESEIYFELKIFDIRYFRIRNDVQRIKNQNPKNNIWTWKNFRQMLLSKKTISEEQLELRRIFNTLQKKPLCTILAKWWVGNPHGHTWTVSSSHQAPRRTPTPSVTVIS